RCHRCAQAERWRASRAWLPRKVNFAPHFSRTRMISHVFHHADDFTCDLGEITVDHVCRVNLLSDRRLTGPGRARERLVDDDHWTRSSAVALIKVAPFEQAHTHGAQIARRYRTMIGNHS